VRQVALVPHDDSLAVSLDDLSRVSAALQKQVTRDFSPIWGVQATVDSFGRLEDVPPGYWPIVLVPHVSEGAGVHKDDDGQPFALVELEGEGALTASHEAIEMLADPSGDLLHPGQSPNQEQGRVEFLVEVCDPCEDQQFAYTCNGVVVSDFYTPHYFDPTGAASVQYSFSGAITAPRQVLAGGY